METIKIRLAIENMEQIRRSVERDLTCLLADQGIVGGLIESYDRAGPKTELIVGELGVNTVIEGKQIADAIYGAIKR